MGNPMWAYKACLQGFAYHLTCHDDMKLARQLNEEKDIEKLEAFITDKKENISEKEFFYAAGMASIYVLMDEYKNGGTDRFNAAIGGLTNFEYFIGLKDDEEDVD